MTPAPLPVRPRAVLFDLFHTLVDVGRVPGPFTADLLGVGRAQWHAACFTAEHDIRNPTDPIEVVRRLAHTIDPTISQQRIAEATELRQQRFHRALRSVDPDTLASLGKLRAERLKLGLVSNASTGEVTGWADSPLRELFDVAVFSCECGRAKPEPGIYRLALDRLGVAPHEAVFVGDGGSHEHRGAAAVGLYPIMLTRFLGAEAVSDPERRSGAAQVVAELSALPGLLGLA